MLLDSTMNFLGLIVTIGSALTVEHFFRNIKRVSSDLILNVKLQIIPEIICLVAAFMNANFEKKSADQVELYGIDYSYGSVMHYSKWGGAANYSRPVMNNIVRWDYIGIGVRFRAILILFLFFRNHGLIRTSVTVLGFRQLMYKQSTTCIAIHLH